MDMSKQYSKNLNTYFLNNIIVVHQNTRHLNVVPKVAATMVIVDMDNAIATLDFQENIAMLLSNAQKDAVDMVNV